MAVNEPGGGTKPPRKQVTGQSLAFSGVARKPRNCIHLANAAESGDAGRIEPSRCSRSVSIQGYQVRMNSTLTC